MAVYPLVSVNDVPLDDPLQRWGVRRDLPARSLPGIRATNVTIPGRSGVLWDTDDPYDTNSFQIGLYVFGNGATENEITASIERNLESLFFLLSQPPLRLTYQWSEEEYRVADARVISASNPVFLPGRDAATIDVIFDIPGVFWRDAFPSNFSTTVNTSNPLSFKSFDVFPLQGSTGPIEDLELILSGPFEDVDIVAGPLTPAGKFDPTIATRLSHSGTVNNTQSMYIDCGAMRAWRQGAANPTWEQVTRAYDKSGDWWASGRDSVSYWLRAWPVSILGGVTQFDRSIYLAVRATGTNGTMRIQVRGKRAFL